MSRKIRITLAATAIGLVFASAVSASETISYTYDARGRLVKVDHAGSTNSNVRACYKYDKADNRVNVTTYAPTPSPSPTPAPTCPS